MCSLVMLDSSDLHPKSLLVGGSTSSCLMGKEKFLTEMIGNGWFQIELQVEKIALGCALYPPLSSRTITQSQIVVLYSRSLIPSLAMLLTPLKEQPNILQDCGSPPAQPGKPPKGKGPKQDAQQNLDGSQNSFCCIYF